MTPHPGVPAAAGASTAEERWAAWVARGVKHDRQTWNRSVSVAGIVAAAIVLRVVIVLLRG